MAYRHVLSQLPSGVGSGVGKGEGAVVSLHSSSSRAPQSVQSDPHVQIENDEPEAPSSHTPVPRTSRQDKTSAPSIAWSQLSSQVERRRRRLPGSVGLGVGTSVAVGTMVRSHVDTVECFWVIVAESM